MLKILRKLAKKSPDDGDLNPMVRWVAEAVNDEVQFNERARKIALKLGSDSIDSLVELLHSEHSPPEELEEKFPKLGQWIAARQFAIFEIFYQFGEAALPVLRRIAFGEYDWVQGNAIEVLCRLAAHGIEQGNIIEELKTNLGGMREEAHWYALGPLLRYSKQDSKIREVLNQLLTVPEFRESYEYLLSRQSDA